MLGVVICLGIALIVILFLFCLQKEELRDLKQQLIQIQQSDSNQKLHSRFGVTDRFFIQQINQLLDEVSRNRIHFQRRNHEIEQMMTNISHDLRTPLTSALGYISMVEHSEMSDEEKEETLQIVENRLIRLKELIDAFFEFSQMISRQELPETKEVNLLSVLEEAVSHYYDDYCEQNRKIEVICNQKRINIISNRNMLMRIFDNLIVNAYKHGAGDLRICITCQNGLGIAFTNQIRDEELDTNRIFDEFYTTDISRTKGNTGLGLAIVKQFAQMLGWDTSATRREDELSIMLKERI